MNQRDDEPANAAWSIIGVTVALSLAYAIVRYHLVGPVPWKDLPFFILNKGIGLSALLLLALNFGLGPMHRVGLRVSTSWLSARKRLGMTGFLLALVHVLISMMLFTPAIYAKFFERDGTLTWAAGLSLLGGVLGFVALWGYNLSFQTKLSDDRAFIEFITSRRFLLVAMLFTGAHLFFMGYEGWLEPGGWHGGLPPISLVSFAAFALAYGFNLFGRE